MDFNDIRTTLQALYAIYDNANSLHTNAYDEAVTTPTRGVGAPGPGHPAHHQPRVGPGEQREPAAGQFIIEELTDLVEEAVLAEFDRIDDRGGVLGAMETGYQRGRIQDESMLYETAQARRQPAASSASTPSCAEDSAAPSRSIELARGADRGRSGRSYARLADFHARHAGGTGAALDTAQERRDQRRQRLRGLMDAVRFCSLGQITEAFFEVGGQYRRNM